MATLQELSSIGWLEFGIQSAEEIRNNSKALITSSKLTGDNTENTVYDPRLGTMDPHENCVTCNRNSKECPGHFGHIELAVPVVHPLHYKYVLSLLRVVCTKCSLLLVQEEYLNLNGLLKYKRNQRFSRICSLVDKLSICMHCKSPQPKISFSPTESVYHMAYKGTAKEEKLLLLAKDIYNIFDDMPDELVTTLGF